MTTGPDELAEQLLEETREEIGRADGKASILLAAAGVAAAAVIGGGLTSDLTLHGAAGVVQGAAAAAAAAMLLGIWALGGAVMPDLGKAVPGRVRFFTDVLAYGQNTQKLRAALEDEAQLGPERCLQQLLAVSKIVDRKYRRSRLGEWAVAAAVVLAIAAGLLNWRIV